jgi:hypothetical protein
MQTKSQSKIKCTPIANSFKLGQRRGRCFADSRDCCTNFAPFENALTSNDVQRGCHGVFRGHGTLKKKLRKTAQKTAAFLLMA